MTKKNFLPPFTLFLTVRLIYACALIRSVFYFRSVLLFSLARKPTLFYIFNSCSCNFFLQLPLFSIHCSFDRSYCCSTHRWCSQTAASL